MSAELFKKIVDECAEFGITRPVHNYGEAFWTVPTEKVRYAKQRASGRSG